MPLEIGIAKATGMEVHPISYPKLKGIDVYENLYEGLKKDIKHSIKMIRKYRKKADYFYIHIKATDIPGHDGKPYDKVKMIEMVDKRLFSYLRKILKDERLIVTADHTTACSKKAHTADPVPVLIYPVVSVKNTDFGEKRFTESEGLKGKKIIGRKLLSDYFFKQ